MDGARHPSGGVGDAHATAVAHLQPENSDDAGISAAMEKVSSEELRAARRRLEDQAIRDQLARDGFKGPMYDRWCEEMARYAISVTTGWVISGQIFSLLEKRRLTTPFTDTEKRRLRSDHDEVESLAGEIVAQTLVRFREQALVSGSWSAVGGASLTTYFMGSSMWAAANMLKSWQSADRRARREVLGSQDDEDNELIVIDTAPTANFPAEITSRDAAEAILTSFPMSTRQALVLLQDGWTSEEIAELTGRSERSIEGLLYRARQKASETHPDLHNPGSRR